ncbi:MAG: hypothetical protein HYT99_05875, partial [Candidatus Tectomicrobia bacterium]|nr:hypothetical protein [Candidatus Tectomicrobia bacterium]
MSKVRKAVFPVAGLGTRFLPATKVIPKEMLPIVDTPQIQIGVQEALDAGIDEIIFITGRGKVSMVDHFDVAFELEDHLRKRRQDVAPDDGQVGGGLLGGRLLHHPLEGGQARAGGGLAVRDDHAVLGDLVLGNPHGRQHRALVLLVGVGQLADGGYGAADEVVAQDHREGLLPDDVLRAE